MLLPWGIESLFPILKPGQSCDGISGLCVIRKKGVLNCVSALLVFDIK